MASPRRIVRIYGALAAHVDEVAAFLSASGGSSRTVALLQAKDHATLLTRWGEEMQELCGVLDGTHEDSYLMEATQTFYWASCFAAVRGATAETLDLPAQQRLAGTCGIGTIKELRAAATRLAGLPSAQVRPEKLFLLWYCADRFYRNLTPPDKQWSIEQILEADLQELKKRPYLAPVLQLVPED